MFRSRRGGDHAGWSIKPDQYVRSNSITYLGRGSASDRHHQIEAGAASDIFRRLNSYSRQHSLYTALKAFGRIIELVAGF